MVRFLALTLLIGFFAFLPSAFADGKSGLFCAAAILFVLRLSLHNDCDHPVGCLASYNTLRIFPYRKKRVVCFAVVMQTPGTSPGIVEQL